MKKAKYIFLVLFFVSLFLPWSNYSSSEGPKIDGLAITWLHYFPLTALIILLAVISGIVVIYKPSIKLLDLVLSILLFLGILFVPLQVFNLKGLFKFHYLVGYLVYIIKSGYYLALGSSLLYALTNIIYYKKGRHI